MQDVGDPSGIGILRETSWGRNNVHLFVRGVEAGVEVLIASAKGPLCPGDVSCERGVVFYSFLTHVKNYLLKVRYTFAGQRVRQRRCRDTYFRTEFAGMAPTVSASTSPSTSTFATDTASGQSVRSSERLDCRRTYMLMGPELSPLW